jgi:hypothetical protein
VLFLVFGSSASGKTSALEELRRRPPERLAIYDFDEVGIPPRATKRFRHEAKRTRPDAWRTTSPGPSGCGGTPATRIT